MEGDETWKEQKLIKNEVDRSKAINDLLTHQYDILPGVLLQCGLLEAKETVHDVQLCSKLFSTLVGESVRLMYIKADYQTTALAAWSLFTDNHTASKYLEQFQVFYIICEVH